MLRRRARGRAAVGAPRGRRGRTHGLCAPREGLLRNLWPAERPELVSLHPIHAQLSGEADEVRETWRIHFPAQGGDVIVAAGT